MADGGWRMADGGWLMARSATNRVHDTAICHLPSAIARSAFASAIGAKRL
jgi:hypothetical protein